MLRQNFNKSVSKNCFIMFYLLKPTLLKGAKRFSIVGVRVGLCCVVVVSFTTVGGSYFCWKSGVMLCGTSGLLVVWFSVIPLEGLRGAVVSLVGFREAVGIGVGMLLSICQGWHLFLSVILPEPSFRTWYCLFGSASITVPLLYHFLKCWRWQKSNFCGIHSV